MDNQCSGLKNGGAYFPFFAYAIFSSNNPTNTAPPPKAANKTTQNPEDEDSEEKKFMLFYLCSMGFLAATGIFCVIFYLW